MVRHSWIVLGLLLVGCADEPEPATPVHHRKKPKIDYGYTFEQELDAANGGWINPKVSDPLPYEQRRHPQVDRDKCDRLQEKANDIARRIKDATEKREEYVKSHCTGTLKFETVVTPYGRRSAGPAKVWLCDGKIIDSPVSNHEVLLASGHGMVVHEMKEIGCFKDTPEP